MDFVDLTEDRFATKKGISGLKMNSVADDEIEDSEDDFTLHDDYSEGMRFETSGPSDFEESYYNSLFQKQEAQRNKKNNNTNNPPTTESYRNTKDRSYKSPPFQEVDDLYDITINHSNTIDSSDEYESLTDVNYNNNNHNNNNNNNNNKNTSVQQSIAALSSAQRELQTIEEQLKDIDQEVKDLLEKKSKLTEQRTNLKAIIQQEKDELISNPNGSGGSSSGSKWEKGFPWDSRVDRLKKQYFGIETFRTHQR